MRNVSNRSCTEIRKTHFTLSLFFSENWAVYEVMWVNTVVGDRPHMTIRRLRIACWIPKARDIHSEYVILSVFAHQKWLREGAKIFRLYKYVNCLVLL
jgi:hypothetical protein